MDKLYVVMPAYNEEANIRTVVSQWYPVVEKRGSGSKLVIVDDGSRDSTYNVLEELLDEFPQLVALTKKNSGHGSTCLYAYRYAVEQGADYVFQTDSDGQTCPEEFSQFWEQRRNYDVIIGCRRERQDGFSRVLVTKVLKFVIFCVFGEWIADANTPYRLIKADKLKAFLTDIPPDFFLSNVMISVLAVTEKTGLKWIPITFRPRQGGINSINLKRIVKIGIKSVKDLYKIKKELREKRKS